MNPVPATAMLSVQEVVYEDVTFQNAHGDDVPAELQIRIGLNKDGNPVYEPRVTATGLPVPVHRGTTYQDYETAAAHLPRLVEECERLLGGSLVKGKGAVAAMAKADPTKPKKGKK